MTFYIISSGTVTPDLVIGTNDQLDVQSGGIAVDATAYSDQTGFTITGGIIDVGQGGTAIGDRIELGGYHGPRDSPGRSRRPPAPSCRRS